MISHKHKCIFVHVPKVAGISIEQVFLNDLKLDMRNRMSLCLGVSTNSDIGPPVIGHLTIKEYLDFHFIDVDIYSNYFKFGFVRNPYDRIYSFYKYLGYSKLISFNVFVTKYLKKLFYNPEMKYFFAPMWDYLSMENKLAVDYVGKLENIGEDIKEVYDKVNLPSNHKLPHANNSSEIGALKKIKLISRIIEKFPDILWNLNFQPDKTKKIYTKKMKEIVFNLYRNDFEKFNYED